MCQVGSYCPDFNYPMVKYVFKVRNNDVINNAQRTKTNEEYGYRFYISEIQQVLSTNNGFVYLKIQPSQASPKNKIILSKMFKKYLRVVCF